MAPSKTKPAAVVTPEKKRSAAKHSYRLDEEESQRITFRTEPSSTSSSKCQRCQKTITKGQIRKGRDYGQGHRWWHEECFYVYNHKMGKAPSNRSKCKKCNKLIEEGSIRVEKEQWVPFRYQLSYYHRSCVSEDELKALGLHNVEPDQGATKTKSSNRDEALRRKLNKLRSLFAEKLSCQVMKVFSDDVITDLIEKKPKTEVDLLKIKGMGPHKVKAFGSALLEAMRQSRQTNSKITSFFQPKKKDAVQIVANLSCEEIVARKFKDAENNGYMIQIGLDDS